MRVFLMETLGKQSGPLSQAHKPFWGAFHLWVTDHPHLKCDSYSAYHKMLLKKSSISLHTLKYKLILFFSFRRGNSTCYESSAALRRSVCGCHADRWHCPGCWFHAMSQSLEGRKPYCLFKVHKGLTTKNITVLTELKGLSGQNTLSEILERARWKIRSVT